VRFHAVLFAKSRDFDSPASLPKQERTSLSRKIIDHVGNVPGNCCLFVYGLHNGTVNVVEKVATSIVGMMSADCCDEK
jgi:hypothetical protein